MAPLSARRQQILKFIRRYRSEHSYPPSVREIQIACEISSTSVVHYNLQILVRDGYIRRDPEVSRGIELLDEKTPAARSSELSVPIIGYIAAGSPLPVVTDESLLRDPLGTVMLPVDSTRRQTAGFYALRVRGLSMIDALIDDGDVVVLRPTQEAHNGEMVVAWLKLEQEATLKRFYHEGNQIRLQPANTQMEPIIVSVENVEIYGKVVAIIRSLE